MSSARALWHRALMCSFAAGLGACRSAVIAEEPVAPPKSAAASTPNPPPSPQVEVPPAGALQELQNGGATALPEGDAPATTSTPQGGGEEGAVKGELVYVTGVDVPAAILAGESLTATVLGNLPTPAWRLLDVEVAVVLTAKPPRIMLTPRAQPPESGTISVQMLQPFERRAQVKDLAEGSYLVVGRGRDQGSRGSERLEVLPGSTLVFVRAQGGIAGIERSIRVTTDKRAKLESSRQPEPKARDLDDALYQSLVAAVHALPPQGRTEASVKGADMLHYQLAWVVDAKLVLSSLDDGTMGERERALVAKLDELF